ncbi:MAG: hypothetical protein WB558_18775 [Terriglobales bacterium]
MSIEYLPKFWAQIGKHLFVILLPVLEFPALVCRQLLVGYEVAAANCILILPCSDIDRYPVKGRRILEMLNHEKSDQLVLRIEAI